MNLPWLDPLKERLAGSIDRGRLGHAPLIHGPAGTGKRLLADWLVARILCREPSGADPCGRCRSCSLLVSGAHPDRFLAAPAEDQVVITVDTIRELSAMLHLGPALGSRRVGHVVPAESMNINAANALLKSLEEPAADAWLVLVSDQPARLPATVRSRCQAVRVHPPDPGIAQAWLAAEIPGADGDDCETALALAGGAPLKALNWLQNGGLDAGREILDRLAALAAGEDDARAVAAKLQETPEASWNWLALWCAHLLRRCMTGRSDVPLPERLLATLEPVRPERMLVCWQDALEGRRLATTPVRHQLLITRWLLQWRKSAEG